jgi:dienelactone hydrolase
MMPTSAATAPQPCPEAHDFMQFHFSTAMDCKRVLKTGVGPPVILMHELPGITPHCLRLAQLIANNGFTVYLPLLLGRPNEHATGRNLLKLCISREFRLWAANKTSPVVAWLRELGSHLHGVHGARGVGVVGMCLTGGFALAMVADEHVLACVAAQPSLPAPLTARHKRSWGLSDEDFNAVARNSCARIIGMRFKDDAISPPQRLNRLSDLKSHLDGVELIELPSDLAGVSAAPHAVLTEELQAHDPQHPTMQALAQVIAMLRSKLL